MSQIDKNVMRRMAPVLVVALILVFTPVGTVLAKTSTGFYQITDNTYVSPDIPDVPVLSSPAFGITLPSLSARLVWNQSTGAVSYNLQLSTDFNFVNLIIDQAGIKNTYFDITSLNKNTSYYWRISASNGSSNSAWSSMWYFKTAFSFVPNAPANLKATRISVNTIYLSWEDRSDNEITFEIERRTGQSPFFTLAILNSNTTSYFDTSAAADATYYYRIKATGLVGDSGYSNEASGAPFLTSIIPPAPVITWPGAGYTIYDLQPQFEWQVSEDAVSYNIQISTNADFSNIVYSDDGISTPYTVVPSDTLDWYTSYIWRVSEIDGNGVSSDWSSPGSFLVVPQDPSNVIQSSCGCGG